MNIYLLFILGLIIPLVILFVFSIYIIISVLNRKNIKLDLFAFNFRFKKRRNIENTEQMVNNLNQQQAVPAGSGRTEYAGTVSIGCYTAGIFNCTEKLYAGFSGRYRFSR